MTHEWHDVFQHGATPVHHLDPRTKLLAAVAFVIAILSCEPLRWNQALAFGAMLLGMLIFSRVSPRSWLTRVAETFPFVLLMVFSLLWTRSGWGRLGEVLGKSLLSISVMLLLSVTTPFPDVLRALRRLRMPRTFLLFLAFLYRYGAVVAEELRQVYRAWQSRLGTVGWRNPGQVGPVIATLFVRAYERAERVYGAMLARGFGGDTPEMSLLHFRAQDYVFLALLAGLLIGIHVGAWP